MKYFAFLAIALSTCTAFAAATPWAQIDSPNFSSLPHQVQSIIDDDRNYFLLISFPPSVGLDFRTPLKLKNSLAVDGWGKTQIGHNMVAWSCKTTDGRWHRAATGFTGENSNQSKDLIMAGWGLASLIAVFSDGYLTPTSTAAEIIRKKHQKSALRFIGLEITPQQCDRVVRFVRQFANSNGATMFGLSGDVNKMEGGGCGSFATAVLEQLRTFNSITPYFWKRFPLPTRLMGKGDSIPTNTLLPSSWLKASQGKDKVSFQRLLNSPWGMTISDTSSHNLTIVDPEMMLYMMKIMQETSYDELDSRDVNVLKKQNKIVVKRMEENFNSDHAGQVGLTFEEIKINYDHRTQAISPAARQVVNTLNNGGLSPRVDVMETSLGVIYEK